ncbi:MAG TPA: 6-bladed beta-propeller, partial [Candidatus Krumholzibacteria bacterium]|nr:6-bladed beta-propeller [Candidatus Krumholzibacteria bacterium]
MERTRPLYVVLMSASLLAATCPPVFAGSWTGKEITKDGVVHEMNPATPSEGNVTLTPHEAWRAGGDDENDALFGVLSSVAVDEQDNVYVLDMQLSQVNVFDKTGKLLRTIGHEGEGPGEFRRANIMFLMPDGNVAVLQQMPGKLVVITPDGKPGADFHGPGGKDGGMIAYMDGGRAGSSIVLNTRSFVQSSGGFSMEKALVMVGADGQ